MVKIGAELPKLSQNKTGYVFLDHPVHREVDQNDDRQTRGCVTGP